MPALALFLALGVAVQQGPPGDREIRTTKDSFTGDTIITLTLMLKGPKAPLPINLVFATTRRVRPKPKTPPVEHRLEFQMELYTGPLDPKPAHIVFVLDKETKDERIVTANIDPNIPLVGTIGVVSSAFTAAGLADLAKAKTIQGRIFGIDFVLTPPQVQAIRDYTARAR